jgi:hypothetical protein
MSILWREVTLMKMTHAQIVDLKARMEAVSAKEVEINEGSDGRLQYYVLETIVKRRPLRPVKPNNVA